MQATDPKSTKAKAAKTRARTRNQPRVGPRLARLIDNFCAEKTSQGATPANVQAIEHNIRSLFAAAAADSPPPQITLTELPELVEQYVEILRAANCSHNHLRDTPRNVLEVLKLSGGDLSPRAIDAALVEVAKTRTASTTHCYGKSVRSFIAWLKGLRAPRFDLGNLDHEAVKRGLDRLAELGWSAKTRENSLGAVKHFCRWASDPQRGHLPRDPAQHVVFRAGDDELAVERIAFSEPALAKLLAAADSSADIIESMTGPERAAAYHAVACTGLRPHQLHGLVVADFELHGERPHVKVARREIPILPPASVDRLIRHFHGNAPKHFAFPNLMVQREIRLYSRLGRAMVVDLKTAGIKQCRIDGRRRVDVLDGESLRLTYCIRAWTAGASIAEISAWLQHAHTSTTQEMLAKVFPAELVSARSKAIQPDRVAKTQAQRAVGRPGMKVEAARRYELLSRYDDAKAKGIRQKDFCEDEGLTLSELEQIVNWRTKRLVRCAGAGRVT